MTKKIPFLLLALLWVGQLGMSQEYDITLKSNNNDWGYAKVVEPATEQSPTATIRAFLGTLDYAFEKWSDGSTQNPRTIVLNKDTTLTAIFIPVVDLPKRKIGDLWYRLVSASHTAFVIRNTADPYTQTEIDIPASVEHDGEKYDVTMLLDSAFYYCTKLKSVTVPKSVTRIASRVFYECSSLESVSLAENVSIVGAYAFGYCKALETITLPKAMTGLGWGAFRYCSNLTSISIKAPVPPTLSPTLDKYVFDGVGTNTLKVPCGSEEAYESAEVWKGMGKTFAPLPVETELNVTIFDGETYKEGGFNESEAGIYTQRLVSKGGCDSTVTLNLAIIEKPAAGFKGNIYGETTSSKSFVTMDDLKDVLKGNTIVTFDKRIPSEWAALPNVVVKGKAKTIDLEHGSYFSYDGGEITAENAVFRIFPRVKASRLGGWMTVVIPFDGEPDITPITTGNPGIGKYWVRKFVESDNKSLYFSRICETSLSADVPYLFAFPGPSYGINEFQAPCVTVTGSDVAVFSEKNAQTTSGDYKMLPSYSGSYPANTYVLDSKANMFIAKKSAGQTGAFSSFATHKTIMAAPMLRSLAILDADEIGFTAAPELPSAAPLAVYAEEGDIVIRASEAGTTSVYSISGQMMRASVIYGEGETRISGLGADTYVVAGRKVVLK